MKLPDPAERERLYLLMEEASEVVQICSKILRHGYNSRHPQLTMHAPNNRMELQNELGDFLVVIDMMLKAGDIFKSRLEIAKRDKAFRVQKWLHHTRNKNFAKESE